MRRLTVSKLIKHFNKVTSHRYYVFKYCRMAGIPVQGLIHDLSKFSPTEFIESARYYVGTDSPINLCKKENGISYAWMHHKGRNPHHYEYWQDNFDEGGDPVEMPYRYAVELICDYLGAGEAYQGKDFTYRSEFYWWMDRLTKKNIAMHEKTIAFVTIALYCISFKSKILGLDKYTFEVLWDYIHNGTSDYFSMFENIVELYMEGGLEEV